MTDHTTNSISKTMPYSSDKNDASNKTVGYENETAKTQTYEEEVRIADKTVGYESEETELIDKTIAHGLAVGDVIELNDKEYEITDIICAENQTGEAIIYKIKNSQGKPFALKLYYQFTNPKDEPNPEALRRIKAISDPDILRLYDFGTGTSKYRNKFCYEISEFAEGSNLISVTDIRKKYTIEFLKLNVIQEIFKGIRTLHDHKIYHCDLKPENILYLDKEQSDLIIGDYGSAKTFEETSEKRLTHTSTTKGTNFYLAPEQPRGIVSEKNDYYSFGMILLHLIYPELVNRDSLHKIIERQFAKKPIIDFNPKYAEINDLIAGLTLHDIGSRWGENEVKGWLSGEDIEIKYKSKAEAAIQPIKLGKATIRTTEELIDYIENNIDWHMDLIEDKEGYGLLLRWVSDIQDLGRKKIFDKMVRNYQQDGEGFLKQSVLRYFTPERPIQIDMKTYDFWTEEKIDELTERFISHLDDIWKITPLEKIKFYIFQLEFTLRQIEAVTQGQQKVLVQSIIEKISSALSISPRLDFDDYVCDFYDGLNDSKLISLFYAFDAKRVFKDLENKEYNTVEDIGLFFARNKNLYGNKYLKLEKEVFFKSNNYSNYVNLSYDEFLYSIFNKNIKSQIQISDVLFDLKKSPKDIQIKYKFGKSLTDFFF
ncbi:MAG: protein kinase [Desulfobacteraceae bacterium]|nr:protein kinase [Desulfobacteraceae bacterium]MBC2718820.1 protein kinase [Desulfobacteraceae bacterium]